MITVNGRTFARTAAELTEAATGFYRRTETGFRLMDRQRKPRVFIVSNPLQGYFAVSCHDTGEGLRYLFSTTSTDEAWLGFDCLSYSQQQDICKSLRGQL